MNVRVVLACVIAVLSVLAGSASQLDTIVGHQTALLVVAVCNLGTAIMAGIMGVLSTQASQAQATANDPAQLIAALRKMPGVSSLLINEKASPDLAKAAITDGDNKVEIAPGVSAKVVADVAKTAAS